MTSTRIAIKSASIKRGCQLMQEKKFEQAIDAFDQAKSIHLAKLLAAECYVEIYQDSSNLSDLDNAINLYWYLLNNPEISDFIRTEASVCLCQCYKRLKEYALAEEALNHCTKPNKTLVLKARATLLREQGKTKQAAELFELLDIRKVQHAKKESFIPLPAWFEALPPAASASLPVTIPAPKEEKVVVQCDVGPIPTGGVKAKQKKVKEEFIVCKTASPEFVAEQNMKYQGSRVTVDVSQLVTSFPYQRKASAAKPAKVQVKSPLKVESKAKKEKKLKVIRVRKIDVLPPDNIVQPASKSVCALTKGVQQFGIFAFNFVGVAVAQCQKQLCGRKKR